MQYVFLHHQIRGNQKFDQVKKPHAAEQYNSTDDVSSPVKWDHRLVNLKGGLGVGCAQSHVMNEICSG